jgi:hypothetical protein
MDSFKNNSLSNDLTLGIIPLMFAERLQTFWALEFVEEIRTDLVGAIVIEKQTTAHSETVTGVPSEELYSSRSSLLTQQ